MSADSFVPQKRSAAACGAAVAAVIYGAALTLLAGTVALPAAHAAGAEHDGPRDEHYDGDRGQGHPDRGRRARDEERHQRAERQRYEQQHYWRYQPPVYVPPPVYAYPPQASPGITFVLPLEIRSR